MNRPKLSVVIAHRNDLEQLRCTIQSLCLAGDDPYAFEMIIVDDFSTTDQKPGGLWFEGCTIMYNKVHKGVGASRQIGAEQAMGDWLIFIDAHMEFPDGWDSKAIQITETVSSRSLVCSTYVSNHPFDPDWFTGSIIGGANFAHIRTRTRERKEFNICDIIPRVPLSTDNDFYSVPCVIGACYLIRRDYFLMLDGFKGLIGYGGDEQLLSWKVLLSGGDVLVSRFLIICHLCQYHRPVTYEQSAYASNKMFIERMIMGERHFNILAGYFPWWMHPSLAAAMGRPLPNFVRTRSMCEVEEMHKDGIQTLEDAFGMMEQIR